MGGVSLGFLVGKKGREGWRGKCGGEDTCEDVLECELDVAGV